MIWGRSSGERDGNVWIDVLEVFFFLGETDVLEVKMGRSWVQITPGVTLSNVTPFNIF